MVEAIMKLYRFDLITDKERPGFIKYLTEVAPTELPEEVTDKFKWDKINVWNFPEQNKIVYVGTDVDELSSFSDGMSEMMRTYKWLISVRDKHSVWIDKCDPHEGFLPNSF